MEKPNVRVSITMPPATRDQLDELSHKLNCSRSALVTALVETGLEEGTEDPMGGEADDDS